MNDNPAEQSSSTEQRAEALGKTEHPQNRALGRAGAVMGRRRDEQTVAATGRARGTLSAALGKQLVDGRRPKKNGSRVDVEVTLLTLTLPALIPCYLWRR